MSLQGTLKTLGITEVLEFLSDRSASGRLDVTTEMGTASYGFDEGSVVEAEYSFIRESGVDAAEATYYVVSELDGTFYFDEDRAPEPQSPGEDVGSVLARTVDIAEKWTDVEDIIPSPNHLLIRNDELDGSVTIQPEWWKALQMIGDGSTSLQLASALELSALDASLTALAMTNAGLLIVRAIDPLDIELEIEVDVAIDQAPVQDPETVVEGFSADGDVQELAEHGGFSFHEAEPSGSDQTFEGFPEEILPEIDVVPESPFQPVDMLEMVDVEAPSPHLDEPTPEAIPEPTMSFAEPVAPTEVSPLETNVFAAAPVEAAPVDEFAGASGMDDLSELEYVLEPDGHSGAVYSSAATPVANDGPAPEAASTLDDDDGWSNGHERLSEPLQPMTSMPTAAVDQPQAEPVYETPAPSPFDVIDVPAPPTPFATHGVPVPDIPGAMDLADLPAPPPPYLTWQ